MDVAVANAGDGWFVAELRDAQEPTIRRVVDLTDAVRQLEAARPRWVWQDSSTVVPLLLEAGIEVERARDLRLSHRILADAGRIARNERWVRALESTADTLFSLGEAPFDIHDVVAEHRRQSLAVADAPGLALLLGAESTGALIAAELLHRGMPWSSDRHGALLEAALGPRPAHGRPAKLASLVDNMSQILGHRVNPDSPTEMLKVLRSQGLTLESTSRWELRDKDHPVIAPLLEYKKLARLWTANGWNWAEQWVRGNRFHAEYVPGGVVTGRWATTGAGAMQIAKNIRGSIVADAGFELIVADAAQLEPRVLAAMSRDTGLAKAARGDLYDGLVTAGIAESRQRAKIAMLGALYGATTGDSGKLVPQLRKQFPKAMAIVDTAAQTGERGESVRSWLGRTSPAKPQVRHDVAASRAWGRFTRNFVVQASAAEWALTWMAQLRKTLRAGGGELVYFLHDEVIVHAPADRAAAVRDEIVDAAAFAGRLLFGDTGVSFPVDARIVHDYGQANDDVAR